MFSFIWMIGFYVVGTMVERVSWRWVPGVLVVAGLDVACRVYLKTDALPPDRIIRTWLTLSVLACVFLALGRWKSSARRRRRRELGLQ